MDVVLDNYLYQRDEEKIIRSTINQIIQKIKGMENVRFGIGTRYDNSTRISIANEDGKPIIPNINCLSLGESITLNLFMNIMRHCDLPEALPGNMQGIVVIDEIDTHLHSRIQSQVLPELIKLFPKIQFIITTHSPLFVLGMEKEFEDDGFDLFEMPTGKKITAERFREFQEAYKIFIETQQFEEDLERQIHKIKKPIVAVEGDYDIRYIKKICKLFDHLDILDKIHLHDAGGYTNLNKIWDSRKVTSPLLQIHKNKALLLYDCDTKVEDKEENKLIKRIIPPLEETLFDRGIENLFTGETIQKIMKEQPRFIDYTKEHEKTERGEEITIPEKYEINENEKGNLCNWICENGTREDFEHFKVIIEILDEFLKSDD